MQTTLTVLICVLAVALVVSNGLWIMFFDLRLKENRNERYELLERIREPETPQVQPKVIDTPSESMVQSQPTIEDEWDAVGAVDPVLPLRQTDGPLSFIDED